jgi:hypothetical protein
MNKTLHSHISGLMPGQAPTVVDDGKTTLLSLVIPSCTQVGA